VPTLQPGDIIILDNLSSHKVDGVQQAVTLAGARVLYLPPYSPDLNPIEKLFSKLRATEEFGRRLASSSAPSPPANEQTTSPRLDM
jgi:transposase